MSHKDYLTFLEQHKKEDEFNRLNRNYVKEHSLYLELLKTKEKQKQAKIKDCQKNSIANLQILINRGLISVDEVLKNYHEHYLPFLHLLSYRVDPQSKTISIFTHAGCGINSLVELSKLFSLCFDVLTFESTIFSLDELKKHFHQNFVLKKSVSHLIGQNIKHPVFMFIWNRDYQTIERGHIFNTFSVEYIHGHDDREPNRPVNVFCLDNKVGYIQIENEIPIPKNNGEEFVLHTNNEFDYESLLKHIQQQILDDFEKTYRILNKRKHSEPSGAALNFKTVIDLFHQVIHEDCPLARFVNIYIDAMTTYGIHHSLEKNQLHFQLEILKRLCLMTKPATLLSFPSIFRPSETPASLVEKLNKIIDSNPSEHCASAI